MTDSKDNSDDDTGFQPSASSERDFLSSVILSGLSAKKSPQFLSSWISLSLALDGRDKITKVVQYSSRFLGWYFESISRDTSDVAASARGISSVFASGRKTYRLGRWITEFAKAKEIVCRAKTVSAETAMSAGRRAGLGGYFLADNLALFLSSGRIGPMTQKNKKFSSSSSSISRLRSTQRLIQEWGMRSMFLSACLGLVLSTRAVVRHRAEIMNSQNIERKAGCNYGDDSNIKYDADGLEKMRRAELKKHFVLIVALVKSISDILSYANNPGVDLPKKIRGRKMSEGLQCIFSLISASTVLYNNFPDVSQKFVSSQLDRKIK